MIDFLLFILWFSVGIAVVAIFNVSSGNKEDPDVGLMLAATLFWPALAIALIYRRVKRGKGGEA